MGEMSETWLPPPYLCKGSQCFYFPDKWSGKIYNLIYSALTVEERDILEHQELTTAGRFPCRFSRYNKSFKHNAKTRKKPWTFKHGENKENSETCLPPPYLCKGSRCFCFPVVSVETVSKLEGTKLQSTVVHKAPTSHLMKTRSTGTTA